MWIGWKWHGADSLEMIKKKNFGIEWNKELIYKLNLEEILEE